MIKLPVEDSCDKEQKIKIELSSRLGHCQNEARAAGKKIEIATSSVRDDGILLRKKNRFLEGGSFFTAGHHRKTRLVIS